MIDLGEPSGITVFLLALAMVMGFAWWVNFGRKR